MTPTESEAKNPAPQPASWTLATLEDLNHADIDLPIAGLKTTYDNAYQRAYSEASSEDATKDEEAVQAQRRVYLMMGAAMSMHLRADNTKQPFGAMAVFADGRRSAIPEDFRGSPLDALSEAAVRVKHPMVRARLNDVCWLLDRKRSHHARAAIATYIDLIDLLESGEFTTLLGQEVTGALCPDGQEFMSRALALSRGIGWDSDEAVRAKKRLADLQSAAMAAQKHVAILWFYDMDLRFGVSDAARIGGTLEELASKTAEPLQRLDLYRSAARAYHSADDAQAQHRCKIAASDCLVTQAEFAEKSPMMASHFLSQALVELHGVPKVRDRTTALRHKLIDAQAGISDEMSSFSHPMDLTRIIEQVKKNIEDLDLKGLLFFFALMERSPDPEKLAEDAKRSIERHPLSSLISSSHHDSDGKVVFRTDGAGTGGDGVTPEMLVQIARAEGLRRQIHVSSQVEVVRQHIAAQYYLGKDIFIALLQYSPFVPTDCLRTYSIGFSHLFSGDFTSAVYILTPMLENSLRHVLRQNGHDVSKFDIGTQTQQDRTISSLFEQMRSELDSVFGTPITTDIDNVFLSQPGPCIRHAVAHGLLEDGGAHSADAIYACWLIFHLCCIPIYQHKDGIDLPI